MFPIILGETPKWDGRPHPEEGLADRIQVMERWVLGIYQMLKYNECFQ